MNKILALACSVLIAIPALADAATTIDQIAPENSVVVMGVPNAAETMKRIEKTSLWALWQSDEMDEMRTQIMDMINEDMTGILEELGLDEDVMVPPTGAVGFALYSGHDDQGMVQPRMLGMADYGDNADKIQELLEAVSARAEEEGVIEIAEEDVRGRTVTSLMIIEEEDEDDEDFNDRPMGLPLPDPRQVLADIDGVYYVREGHMYLVSTALEGLEQALESIDDKGDVGTGFAEREDFKNIKGKLGDVDVWGVMLTRDLFSVIGGAQGMEMMVMMMMPVIDTVFGKIAGAGGGWRFDSDQAMVESVGVISMPSGKVGIPALFEKQTPRGDLPPFVGPDTVLYQSMNIETSEIPGLIRNIIQSTPMLQMQLGEQVPQIMAVVEQICGSMGTKAHQFTAVQRPMTIDSLPSIFAIECTEPESLESAIAGLAPQLGLEPRDFLGHRIFAPSDAMMPMGGAPPSMGIGGGYLIIGPAGAVEQALRSVGQSDGHGLDGEPQYERAVGLLGSEPMVAWGYMDMVRIMGVTMEVTAMANEQLLQQMREEFPEFADELEADEGDLPEFMKNMNFDVLKQYIGPTVWNFHSTDDGFTTRGYLLAPAK